MVYMAFKYRKLCKWIDLLRIRVLYFYGKNFWNTKKNFEKSVEKWNVFEEIFKFLENFETVVGMRLTSMVSNNLIASYWSG